ncbi:MAG: sugar ABC transporter permease [Spirochaetaceae bacterium]|jgi:raffinose/stachyose/melibiose transport system permease protein|nr:sugar ABC transporter permease [Spirochaetaceae bacterium]
MKRKTTREYLIFCAFVLPLFLPFVVFFIIPAVSGIIYSFFNWNGISSNMNFIGFKNFRNLLQDKVYITSMQFSSRFAVLSVVIGNILSMLLALWVNTKIKSSNFIRAAFFMPMVICPVVKGFLWRFIYNQGFTVLYKFIPLPFLNTKILASGEAAFYGILVASLWGGIGYNMIIYLAGLASIDKTYYESADIDGANSLTKFFRITIPMLMPSITICLFTSTASSFGIYDMNQALTVGGPGNSTLSMVLDIYNTGFLQNRLGYGSAKSVVLLIIIMTITFLQVSVTRKREVEL